MAFSAVTEEGTLIQSLVKEGEEKRAHSEKYIFIIVVSNTFHTLFYHLKGWA